MFFATLRPLLTETQPMRETELKILATAIPQLATSVRATRSRSLTGYPLARLCEWSPAPSQQLILDGWTARGLEEFPSRRRD